MSRQRIYRRTVEVLFRVKVTASDLEMFVEALKELRRRPPFIDRYTFRPGGRWREMKSLKRASIRRSYP